MGYNQDASVKFNMQHFPQSKFFPQSERVIKFNSFFRTGFPQRKCHLELLYLQGNNSIIISLLWPSDAICGVKELGQHQFR